MGLTSVRDPGNDDVARSTRRSRAAAGALSTSGSAPQQALWRGE